MERSLRRGVCLGEAVELLHSRPGAVLALSPAERSRAFCPKRGLVRAVQRVQVRRRSSLLEAAALEPLDPTVSTRRS